MPQLNQSQVYFSTAIEQQRRGLPAFTLYARLHLKPQFIRSFSAYTVPLGNNKFWLEDRKTVVFTDLSSTTYTATLSANTHGTGRFYLKAGTAITGIPPDLVNPDEPGVGIQVSKNMLYIEGKISAIASCTVYDIFGHKVRETKLTDARLNTISIPIVVNGIYVVRITGGNKTVTKKVFL